MCAVNGDQNGGHAINYIILHCYYSKTSFYRDRSGQTDVSVQYGVSVMRLLKKKKNWIFLMGLLLFLVLRRFPSYKRSITMRFYCTIYVSSLVYTYIVVCVYNM